MSEVSQQATNHDIQKSPVSTRYKAGFVVLLIFGAGFLGLATVFWYTTSAYTELLHGVAPEEASVIAAELQNNNISYRYEPTTGAISVLSEELQYARIKLGAKGLLYNSEIGKKHQYVGIDQNSTRGSDIQRSPHQILESELAKSIASIDYVQSARIHLALANVAGVDNSQISRASVVVRLYPGRRLTEAQITSISHLIASSVGNLSSDNITIIDQSGKLLKSAGVPNTPSQTAAQISYARRVEQSYLDRIENILAPILDTNAVRSQVAAELVFNDSESSNPPKRAGNNNLYETENVRRLSATIIVDNRLIDNGDGQLIWVTRSAEEMKRITDLVKHAVDFNAQRGDIVNVINEPFNLLQNKNVPLTSTTWQRHWLKDAKWYLIIGLVIMFVGIIALRSKRAGVKITAKSAVDQGVIDSNSLQLGDEPLITELDNKKANIDIVSEKTPFEQSMLRARQMVREEPKIVAQIVKSWVKEGG